MKWANNRRKILKSCYAWLKIWFIVYFWAQLFKIKTMFGDMMGMMGKLKETQQKVEDTKKRMETVLIDESSSDDLLKTTVTASRTIKAIQISDELLAEKEQLEDYLILTLNKALSRAEGIYDQEIAAVAKDGMPNIPGMDLFK